MPFASIRFAAVALLPLAPILGCASSQVRSQIEPGADFARYETFSVRAVPADVDDESLTPDEAQVKRRIENALRASMIRKGLREASRDPDLIVEYEATVLRDAPTQEAWTTGPRYFGSYLGNGFYETGRDPYTIDALVVDVIDPVSSEVVFHSVTQPVDKAFQRMQSVRETADEALREFPSSAAQP